MNGQKMENRLEDEEEIQPEEDAELEEDVCIIGNTYPEESCS